MGVHSFIHSHRIVSCHGGLRVPTELGKWRQRGEYQPAVGVLLITQGVGVDGDGDTGL